MTECQSRMKGVDLKSKVEAHFIYIDPNADFGGLDFGAFGINN